MAARLGNGAGLFVVALGTAIIVASLTLGLAAAMFRERPDLTEYQVDVVGAGANEEYVLHVTGPSIDATYSIFRLSGDVEVEGPDAWRLTVPASAAIDVYGSDCVYLGRVSGPWGPRQRTLTLKPAPKGVRDAVKGIRFDAATGGSICWQR